MTELTTEEKRKYVEERWTVNVCDESYRNYIRGTVLIWHANNDWTAHRNMKAAYQYTLAREEEIRKKRAEIAVMITDREDTRGTDRSVVYGRILAVLESQLSDLLRGFKEVK